MITYIRKYDDASFTHSKNHKDFLDWGNADDCDDFEVDLDAGIVTKVRAKNGWVKEGGADVYYDHGDMLGYFEKAAPKKYTGGYFVYVNKPGMSFFACETDTDNLKQLIERTAR